MHSSPWLAILLSLANIIVIRGTACGDENAPPPAKHCLILVGLPGDAPHRTAFQQLLAHLQAGLSQRGFTSDAIDVLCDRPDETQSEYKQINADAIRSAAANLTSRLRAEDSFWLFMIGHADHDGEHARFHLPGPDLRAVDYADLFEDLKCKEQVFWLTTGSSGWFAESMSKPDRVVVTATTRDSEPNETEFPAALCAAISKPDAELDLNADGAVCVLELFAKTHALVEASYKADDRAVTEHAMIEDQGDGKGTEWEQISAEIERIGQLASNDDAEIDPSAAFGNWKTDGALADALMLPPRIGENKDSADPKEASATESTPATEPTPQPIDAPAESKDGV